jgi:predicted nucleotidyltransferase component of viral defense system
MHIALQQMLEKYKCESQRDYLNAPKEIIQEIALLGLWRAKFQEKAAFYGGSALRILYGLDRFSEDLDFTLLKADNTFQLDTYNQAIEKELHGFGFDVKVEKKINSHQSTIESAFIKANSKIQLLTIEAPASMVDKLHSMHLIKIKMEVDISPPRKFSTEAKTLLQPIPFSVNTLTLPDLFAGKIHAILCRPWVTRVKGRDWYDFVWYLRQGVAVNLIHLQERLQQSDAWPHKKDLTLVELKNLLLTKIEATDFQNAKKDVLPFIKDSQALDLWTKAFFVGLLEKLKGAD